MGTSITRERNRDEIIKEIQDEYLSELTRLEDIEKMTPSDVLDGAFTKACGNLAKKYKQKLNDALAQQ